MSTSPALSGSSKVRKRQRVESSSSELESELDECDLESARVTERKLRKVAKEKSLSDAEMRKLLGKLIRNDHVLALVSLKAEDAIAKEKELEEKPTLIITDIPSAPKLTRAKARELKQIPGIALPSLTDEPNEDIAKFIREDLNSDEEDEEYTFKDEDFISDEDPNTTVSDLDSNPRTPQTPLNHTGFDDSPAKLTADGCFKVPLVRRVSAQEDLLIATRTRSKLCLEKTTIEDIESEFVPPDVEQSDANDTDLTTTDEDWMQFLNDFSKPLNSTNVGDDDDPINDPEYVAAEKITVDAEELRDVNISKKELTELIAELFEGLLDEEVPLESVHLETPERFLSHYDLKTDSSNISADKPQTIIQGSTFIQSTSSYSQSMQTQTQTQSQICLSDSTISSSNLSHTDPYSNTENTTLIPIAHYSNAATCSPANTVYIPEPALKTELELIAVPKPGQPNCFQLAKVVDSKDVVSHNISTSFNDTLLLSELDNEDINSKQSTDTRYSIPYDSNFTWEYISIKKHIYSEYVNKFEYLRQSDNSFHAGLSSETYTGLTLEQHDLLQQQLRLHVQMLTQTFLQTYSHPNLWTLAPKCKELVLDLEHRAENDASFKAWNLKGAVDLIKKWEEDLAENTAENREFMSFIYKEIDKTNRNTRQIVHFPPRTMELILNSTVFVYPQYLPRIPFSSKKTSYPSFSPSESYLIAFGLEKHMARMQETGERIPKNISPYRVACGHLCKDTVFGKTKRRVWDHIKYLRKQNYYNPIKYYFEHEQAPSIENRLIPFNPNEVLPPKLRLTDLPLRWKKYVQQKEQNGKLPRNQERKEKVSQQTTNSFIEFVREAVDENVDPNLLTKLNADSKSAKNKKSKKETQPTALTVNVNYMFGAGPLSCSPHCSLNTSKISNLSQLDDIDQVEEKSPSTRTVSCDFTLNSSPVYTPLKSDLNKSTVSQSSNETPKSRTKPKTIYNKWKPRYFGNISKYRRSAKKHLAKQKLKIRCIKFLRSYYSYLQRQNELYQYIPLIQHYYSQFKALELFTDLLIELKAICQEKMSTVGGSMSGANTSSKRTRPSTGHPNEDDVTLPLKTKKTNRQEESYRQMLLPDTTEDANRKDAIFAFNFYEKVEVLLKSSDRPEDFKQFTEILKSFDPHKEKVADLYIKLEKLFLPDHAQLAEIFLTFLLPTEALEIGKFFEHFMINNMATFINKLNIYFNKQPAQIRKIYNCLNELAENPDVTVNQIEVKILPLLKGNQFLIDWFLQQFPGSRPPERLLTTPEQVNLKEAQNNSGEFVETVTELLESPTNDNQQGCQLKYMNGRIFYGNKVTLPAKLSFMASNYQDGHVGSMDIEKIGNCVHAIREHGEKQLAAANSATVELSTEETEKVDDEDVTKAPIETTSGEEDTFEVCDYVTLRGHAIRLNPNYYGNSGSTNFITSTPNFYHQPYSHNKRYSLNSTEENKISPRKHTNSAFSMSSYSNLSSGSGPAPTGKSREKRNSPTKKTKSPVCTPKSRINIPPMVVIHEQNPAITCAKKLKSLIEEDNESVQDMKESINIVARTKDSLKTKRIESSCHGTATTTKVAIVNDNSQSAIKSDKDQHIISSSTYMDSDEDCKIDVVTSLTATEPETNTGTSTTPQADKSNNVCSTLFSNNVTVTSSKPKSTWTRDEDKAILIEMKLGSRDRDDLFCRIKNKLPQRTLLEIESRHQFLMDFLSKLQGT